ncbi:MAG: acylphosphatase [Bacillota bacterium]
MTQSQQLIRVHLYLSGRVQGVGFRNFTCHQATKLGLTGWVQNLDDGRVEAVITGLREDVDQILEQLKSGPALA